jgi:hypothetical protein
MTNLVETSSRLGVLRFKDLSVVLVLLVLADGLITLSLTGQGLGRETNPFVRHFIAAGSLLPLKVLGAIIVTLILWDVSLRQARVALAVCAVSVAAYTAILYWNLGAIWLAAL